MPDNTTWSGPSLEDYVTQAQNSFIPQEFWSPGGGGDSADVGHSIFSQFDPLQSVQTYLSDRQAARPWWNEGYDFLSGSLNNNGAAEKFANDIGYTGNVRTSLPTGMDTRYSESDTTNTPTHTLDPSFLDQLHNYNFSTGTEHGNPFLYASDKSGKQIGGYQTGTHDNLFDKFVYTVGPMVIGAGFGAGVGGALGGGTVGGAAGGATSGAIQAGFNGGDVTKGALTGAVGGAAGGYAGDVNPAGYVGIENPTLAGMFNKGVGSAVGTGLSGGSGQQILQSGLTGAATAGLNSLGKPMSNAFNDMFSKFSAPDQTYDSGGMSYSDYSPNGVSPLQQAGVSPEMSYPVPGSANYGMGDISNFGLPSYSSNTVQNASYPEGYNSRQNMYDNIMGDKGVSLDPNASTLNIPGSFLPSSGGSMEGPPQQQIANFSMPSGLSTMGSNIGSYLGNHAGDLASMLYGFYNNKRQQGALNQNMNSLKDLYSQNSPYAQQLRAKLYAQAAAKGTRANTAGREVQLQAALADKAASTAPSLYQMQQGQMGLQNNNMNMLLQGMNKLGGWQGLKSLFNPTPSLTGQGSLGSYGRMDDMYSNMGEG